MGINRVKVFKKKRWILNVMPLKYLMCVYMCVCVKPKNSSPYYKIINSSLSLHQTSTKTSLTHFARSFCSLILLFLFAFAHFTTMKNLFHEFHEFHELQRFSSFRFSQCGSFWSESGDCIS